MSKTAPQAYRLLAIATSRLAIIGLLALELVEVLRKGLYGSEPSSSL